MRALRCVRRRCCRHARDIGDVFTEAASAFAAEGAKGVGEQTEKLRAETRRMGRQLEAFGEKIEALRPKAQSRGRASAAR